MNERNNVCYGFEPSSYGFNVKIIGVGGGALNILNQFSTESIHDLEFIAIDDEDGLGNSPNFATKFSVEN